MPPKKRTFTQSGRNKIRRVFTRPAPVNHQTKTDEIVAKTKTDNILDSKELINAAKKKIEDRFDRSRTIETSTTKEKYSPIDKSRENPSDEVSQIQKLIEQATKRLSELENDKQNIRIAAEKSVIEEEDHDFDGVMDDNEHFLLLEKELDAARRKNRSLEHQLEAMRHEFEDERKQFEMNLKTIKKDFRREAPLHDHRFFSLSKELQSAMSSINKLVDGTEIPNVDLDEKSNIKTMPPAETVKSDEEKPESLPASVEPEKVIKEKEDDTSKPIKKKKKLLITGGATALILIGVSTVLASMFGSNPQVNEELVSEYLQQQGIEGVVQGVQDKAQENENTPTEQPISKPVKNAQSEVSFAETTWEKFSDPSIGFEIEYPHNAVDVIKTESSITLVRKSGYIFKVTRVDTALDLNEYWKQIQATSLNYKVSEITVASEPALFLELEDIVDYPGDRYLVKKGNALFDIWFATASERFSPDDVQRVQQVVSSIKLI